MPQRRGSRSVAVGIACLFMILLSACGIGRLKLDLTLYPNERYQMEFIIDVSPEGFAWIPRADYEQQLKASIAELRADGYDASLKIEEERDSGEVRYLIRIQGQGYADLSSQGLQIEAVTYHGRDAVSVYVEPFGFGMLGSPLTSLTVRGSRILESNGIEMERGVVMWRDLSEGAHVVLLPVSGVNWGTIVLVVLVAGGVVAAIVVGGKARRRAGHRRDGVAEQSGSGQTPS